VIIFVIMAGKRKHKGDDTEESENEEESEQEVNDDENEDEDNESGTGGSGTGSGSDNDEDDDDNEDGSGSGESGSDDEDGDDNDSDDAASASSEEKPKQRRKSEPKKPAKRAAAKKPAKKAAPKKKKKVVKKKTAEKSSSGTTKIKVTAEKKVKIKSLKKTERLEEARKAFKWWEAPKLASGVYWNYLEHPAIAFPPSYEPHHIPLLYEGKEMKLNPEQEEMATFFAAMPPDGPQLGNEKTRPVFQKNFFDDFREILGNGHPIKKFEDCDFTLIRNHLAVQKNLKKVATDEEKALKKEEKERMALKYGYSLIDGRLEKVFL
jgi:DNA topoisomerase-1